MFILTLASSSELVAILSGIVAGLVVYSWGECNTRSNR